MMAALPEPNEDNAYLAEHIHLLRKSLQQLVGRDLVEGDWSKGDWSNLEAARAIYHAPFVVVSHNAAADPVFNYGNRAALQLFEMTWQEFTTLPSRLSAEPPNRDERARLLATVATQGYIENYSGIRISKGGRRFRIEPVTVWNLQDSCNCYYGQAAVYSTWTYLPIHESID